MGVPFLLYFNIAFIMSEYNIDKINNPNSTNVGNTSSEQPKYGLAFFAGLGVSVIVGIILAVLGIWLESESVLALTLGALAVAGTIHCFVPQNSKIGAIIGAILCPTAYLIYQFIMAIYGYYYEDGDSYFWFMLIGSVILGAWMGYNNEND